MFEKPEAGNFGLASDSAAVGAGFRPLDPATAGRIASPQSPRVILLRMQHAKHHHAVTDHLVEDLIWETPQNDATKVPVIDALPLRILFQSAHGNCDRIKEVSA